MDIFTLYLQYKFTYFEQYIKITESRRIVYKDRLKPYLIIPNLPKVALKNDANFCLDQRNLFRVLTVSHLPSTPPPLRVL